MSKSKISILAISVLFLALTIFLGYYFKGSDSASSASAEKSTQERSKNDQAADQKQSNQQPKSQQSESQQPGSQQPKSNIGYVDSLAKDVALVVNGENFSTEDFERRLHKTQFVFKANGLDFENNSEEILAELEETVINELVLERVVMQLAQEFKIVASDEEVQQRLAATKQNFSAEEWQQLLDSRGITEENLNTYNKIQLTQANLINWLGGEQQFTDYLSKKIKESKVTVNKPLIKELLTEL